jgi:hypothetical protein
MKLRLHSLFAPRLRTKLDAHSKMAQVRRAPRASHRRPGACYRRQSLFAGFVSRPHSRSWLAARPTMMPRVQLWKSGVDLRQSAPSTGGEGRRVTSFVICVTPRPRCWRPRREKCSAGSRSTSTPVRCASRLSGANSSFSTLGKGRATRRLRAIRCSTATATRCTLRPITSTIRAPERDVGARHARGYRTTMAIPRRRLGLRTPTRIKVRAVGSSDANVRRTPAPSVGRTSANIGTSCESRTN